MKSLKLQFAFCFVPFLGFVIVLFWGMIRLYRNTGKRSYAFRYVLLCMIPLFALGGVAAGGCYLIFMNITRANIPLILGLNLCFLCVVCWLMAGACLFIQNKYARRIMEKEQLLSIS